jgi:hypothetical protein
MKNQLVLVVDDTPINLELMQSILISGAHEVALAKLAQGAATHAPAVRQSGASVRAAEPRQLASTPREPVAKPAQLNAPGAAHKAAPVATAQAGNDDWESF